LQRRKSLQLSTTILPRTINLTTPSIDADTPNVNLSPAEPAVPVPQVANAEIKATDDTNTPTTDISAVPEDGTLYVGPNGDIVWAALPWAGIAFVAAGYTAVAAALGGAWLPHFKHKDDLE